MWKSKIILNDILYIYEEAEHVQAWTAGSFAAPQLQGSILSSGYCLCRVPPTFHKQATKWICYSTLPLGVNEIVNVCVMPGNGLASHPGFITALHLA